MTSLNNAARTNGITPQPKLRPVPGVQQAVQQQVKSNGATEAQVRANDYAAAGVRNEAEMKMLAEYAIDYAHSIGKE